MAETYPVKADGQYAGEYCALKSCRNQARFALAVFGKNGDRVLTCGHHLSIAIRGMHILEQRPVVIQEIPGYRSAAELVLLDGQLMRVPVSGRKVME
jgi:hypothetical protein